MSEEAASINVELPDGAVIRVAPGSTALDVAGSIGPRLAKAAVAAELDGALVDLTHPIRSDAKLRLLTPRDPESLEVLRHSTAHATAQAVQELFPGTKIAQGPVIEDGFYYDFDRAEPFTDKDLEAIEQRVGEIVARDLPVERIELPRDEAIAYFEKEEEPYKVYFARTKGGELVSIYRQGEWDDFCRGPHVASTGRLGVFKLLSVAGAYWLGDERNQMITASWGASWGCSRFMPRHRRAPSSIPGGRRSTTSWSITCEGSTGATATPK
jgi:threonyl-tRNA synthetase